MDVVVVGSCMTDLVSSVPRLPSIGETLHGHDFNIGFGGKGANQCVVASRLGAKTAMVAKVGFDTFGDNHIQNFKNNGVNIDHVKQTSEAPTGVAPIAVDDNGQNAIIIVAGANLKLTTSDVVEAETVISGAKVVICQLEIKHESTLEALRLARKNGVTTILNPAPAAEGLDPELYKTCDIFCPNETEAELLIKKKMSTIDDAKDAIAKLQSLGCRTVIITMGENGAVFATQDDPTPIHIPAPSVTPVDTTGAGDAFVGTLAYYLACHPGLPLATVIKHACSVASISVCKLGTQTSYPYAKDLPDHIPH